MDSSLHRNRSDRDERSPLDVAIRLIRRLFNLHGSAVNNAAASVRADDAAREARDSAADAVALAATSPGPPAT